MTDRRVGLSWTGIPLSMVIIAILAAVFLSIGSSMGWWEVILVLVAAVGYVAVGALILAHNRAHRIGWAFVLAGFSLILSGVAGTLAQRGLVVGDAIGGALWFSWLLLGSFVMLWFPTGHVQNSRWKWVEWLGYFGVGISVVGYTFAGQLCGQLSPDDNGCIAFVDNPIGISWIPNPEYGWISGIFLLLLAGFTLMSVASLATRFSRSTGVERQQIKWFVFAVGQLLAWIIVDGLFVGATSGVSIPYWLGKLIYGAAILALPIAAAIAILRYRLFEIDRIVSRTLGYALVIVFLALTYSVGAVWLPTQIMGEQTPPLFVAGSTLVVAALFNPVRRRVLGWVDARFYRSRYDAEQVALRFVERLRDQTDVDVLVDDWVSVVSETVQPSLVGVWVKNR